MDTKGRWTDLVSRLILVWYFRHPQPAEEALTACNNFFESRIAQPPLFVSTTSSLSESLKRFSKQTCEWVENLEWWDLTMCLTRRKVFQD